jgi:hypothetical protein
VSDQYIHFILVYFEHNGDDEPYGVESLIKNKFEKECSLLAFIIPIYLVTIKDIFTPF